MITCIVCGKEIEPCGCTAEMYGPGHDEEHCIHEECR